MVWLARAVAVPVEVGEAPDNNLKLTVQAIHSAKRSLYINIYEMKSNEIADAIVERIGAGVHVEILNEGQPVGGVSDVALEIRERIVGAMREGAANARDRFWLMTSEDRSERRRFRFDHAKYVVVDEASLLIGSENFSNRVGRPGNRGWQVWIHDPAIASQYLGMFRTDSSPKNEDVRELVGERDLRIAVTGWGLLPFLASDAPDRDRQVRFKTDIETLDADGVAKVISPDSSLAGLLKLLNDAQKTIDLELMTFSPRWGTTGKISPLLKATIDAARRGVKIRVLLNDESVFAGGGHGDDAVFEGEPLDRASKNQETVDKLNELAESEGLSVEARIADVKAMKVNYIHNKGGLVDGKHILVSSINWNQNSVENNREAAVVLNSRDIHRYYHSLFDADWAAE